MNQYRKQSKKINHFEIIKKEQIQIINNEIRDRKKSLFFNRWQLTFSSFLVVLLISLLFPLLLQRGENGPNPNQTNIIRVSAQEVHIDGDSFKIGFKSFVLRENNDLIRYNDDFSYYKNLSKYEDLSYLIGNDVSVEINYYIIHERNFLEVDVEGDKSYYEITFIENPTSEIKSYMEINNLKEFTFTNFEREMNELLDVVQQYPPIPIENQINQYTINEQVHDMDDQSLIKQYKTYVDQLGHGEQRDSSYKTSFNYVVFNYLVFVQESKDGIYTITHHQPRLHVSAVEEPENYNLEENYFDPNADGFDIVLNNEEPLKFSRCVEPDFTGLETYLFYARYGESTNEKYNKAYTTYFLFKLLDPTIELGKVEITDRHTGEIIHTIDEFISVGNYRFTIPVINDNSNSIWISIKLYDINGQVIGQYDGTSFTINI